ncbi:hypothetical protein I2485_01890 [Nesterenkonia sp. E16_7]|uniref:hypothetical protein n=1 Tax=unclassified Nesterenkonia TaxID=2629769 RepID=UPI001A938BF8|nr:MULTISPECIES: hypothetical protein [unclassified Nesterenkonia]MBO0596373.1 hypothetical protein [Nesterenkonia sp. E16_10]MBO0597399.1 hypothetical protein [Nesterenkonia sp. E16_7]
MKRSAPAILIGVALLAVSCSDDQLASPAPEETASGSPDTQTEPPTEDAASDTPEQSEPPTDPDLPSDDDIESFVSAIASSTISDLENARDLVVEDSPAANYLTYFRHSEEAAIDGGLPAADVNRVDDIDGGFEMCATADGEERCSTYTDFEGDEGRITNFQIQDRNLADRLKMGTGEEVEGPGGSTFKLVAAYRNANDSHLLVGYEMRSGDRELEMPLASYRGAEGRQSSSDGHIGSFSLAPDSMSHYVVSIPNADPGGELFLEVYGDDIGLETVTLTSAD